VDFPIPSSEEMALQVSVLQGKMKALPDLYLQMCGITLNADAPPYAKSAHCSDLSEHTNTTDLNYLLRVGGALRFVGGFASSETGCRRLIIRCSRIMHQDSRSETANIPERSLVSGMSVRTIHKSMGRMGVSHSARGWDANYRQFFVP